MKTKRNFVFFLLFVSLSIVLLNNSFFNCKNDQIIKKWTPHDDVVEMPIVLDSKSTQVSFYSNSPIEQRDEEYIRFLQASVKIRVNGASGSGTIFYYDSIENWAYVVSCGHLWSGNYPYNSKTKREKANIIVWYHKNKLDSIKTYEAEVLFWSNERGYDCSCLRFKPAWIPNYFPIAGVDYKINKKEKLNSLGCDGGDEVARYEVEFFENRGLDLITQKNSPRPGRSGGGLLTDSGYLVGVCWGTSDVSTGNGIGYFTPLKSIHKVFLDNDLNWLLDYRINIPIHDEKNPKKNYEWNFIPFPARHTNKFKILFD